MSRRCVLKKRQLLYVLMTSVFGVTLYNLFLSPLLLTFVKRNIFKIRPNTRIDFKLDHFIKRYPVAKLKYLQRTTSKNPSKTSEDNNDRHSETIDTHRSNNVENKSHLRVKNNNAEDEIEKTLEVIQLNTLNNDMSPSLVGKNSILPNWSISSKKYLNHRPRKASIYLMNASDHSCKPLFPKVVLYNRIFKTASTTMSSFLEKSSSKLNNEITKESTEEWSSKKISHPILRRIRARAKRSKRRGKRLLAVAHFYFRIDSRLNLKHTYINLLREPIERFISHYYYARSPIRWPKKLRRLKALGHWNVTLEQCLEKQFDGCKWNVMTRFFCGSEAFCKTGNKKALSWAKYNMLHYYSCVGVVEHLNEFIQVLHKRLPKFIIKTPKILEKQFVTTGVRKTTINNEVMARIVQVNQADIELYTFAKTLFLKQAKQCGVKVK